MFDLIGSLTSEVGLEPNQAKAMASRFLEYLASLIEERYGDEAVRLFSDQLPHWAEWQEAEPPTPVEAVPAFGGFLGVDQRLKEIFGDLGIDPVKAGIALPALVAYLKRYLSTDQIRQVLSVAPFLSTAAPEYSPRGVSTAPGGMNA